MDASNAAEAIVLIHLRLVIYNVLLYPPTNTAYSTVGQIRGKKWENKNKLFSSTSFKFIVLQSPTTSYKHITEFYRWNVNVTSHTTTTSAMLFFDPLVEIFFQAAAM